MKMYLNRQQNPEKDTSQEIEIYQEIETLSAAKGRTAADSPISRQLQQSYANEIKTGPTSTTSSYSSSTDSGVNVSDNESSRTTANPLNQEFQEIVSNSSSSNNKKFFTKNTKEDKYNKNNNNKSHHISGRGIDTNKFDSDTDNNELNDNNSNNNDEEITIKIIPNFDKNCENKAQEIQLQQSEGNRTQTTHNCHRFNKENLISGDTVGQNANETSTSKIPTIHHIDQDDRFSTGSSVISSEIESDAQCRNHKEYIPSRNNMYHSNANNCSPTVSIRSIDSSVIDSDSDLDVNDDDVEGVHENYVIKKLGTQVNYMPRDPNIPNVNKGLTLVNQKIAPTGAAAPSPIAALASLGDNVGRAHSLGVVPSVSTLATAQRPQIGSISMSNSSDVTFGDKHFYEGPVTIQQFLIDNRDKAKEVSGKDNPTFSGNPGATPPSNAKETHYSPATAAPFCSNKPYKYIVKRKRYLIPAALTLIALLTAVIIFGSEVLNDSKNDSATEEINDCVEGKLCLMQRYTWNARKPKGPLDLLNLPVSRAIISHTASEPCNTFKMCAYSVRVIQAFHMDSFQFDDIGYNFLIAGNGQVFEGRGWDNQGAHTKGYNIDSIGITFIGTFLKEDPTKEQLSACRLLLEEGVRLKKLQSTYKLYGARQLSATESPGDNLFNIIKRWPHWSPT